MNYSPRSLASVLRCWSFATSLSRWNISKLGFSADRIFWVKEIIAVYIQTFSQLTELEDAEVEGKLWFARSAFVWYPPNPLLSGLISGFIEWSLDSSLLALVGTKGWPIAATHFHKLAHIQGESFVPYICLLVHSCHTLLSELFCSRGAEEVCEMFAETPHCRGHKWWGYKRKLEPFIYLKEFYSQFLEPLTASGHPHFSSTNIMCKIEGEKRWPADDKKIDDNSHCCSKGDCHWWYLLIIPRLMVLALSR